MKLNSSFKEWLFIIIYVLPSLSLLFSCTTQAQDESKLISLDSVVFLDEYKFRQNISQEFIEHAIWERMYLISETAALPDKGNSFNRMTASPNRLINLINNFYDPASTQELKVLLEWHSRYYAEYVFYSNNNMLDSLYDVRTRWYKNSDKIAAKISRLNEENWSATEMTELFREHNEKTENEVRARIDKKWDSDIKSFDIIINHSIIIADKISEGLVSKFPEKFKTNTPELNKKTAKSFK